MNRRAREEEIINANNPIDKYKWIGDPSASDVSNAEPYYIPVPVPNLHLHWQILFLAALQIRHITSASDRSPRDPDNQEGQISGSLSPHNDLSIK
ncbi:hypothetical protein N7509_001165 [Penicillium cosmopolitanum]|uniref:Uncharacterized protein n=1 Tax=Penicillium cosmopolitanum TaxID=1131564 RepID=A0A9W9WC63_9EURO|nr:uncharacterized protein N7509_001165 [Penicillium cosmopolitanum]KAJ5414538.1 hypothetical protein N7509_001165 [Penicillium cosmopolitanum]